MKTLTRIRIFGLNITPSMPFTAADILSDVVKFLDAIPIFSREPGGNLVDQAKNKDKKRDIKKNSKQHAVTLQN